jgi:NAD(P)-dependent dehydrogenase (short-subunit alcohol dehydrogenase family)
MTRYSGIDGKRILITGSTSGLGLAMARALLSEKAKVLITGRDQHKIDYLLETLRSFPGEAQGVALDVQSEESVRQVVKRMISLWGGIDVLINNAGVGMRTVNPEFLTDPKPFWDVSVQGFRDLIDTNLTGYFLVAKEVVPHFLERGRGRMINISMNHETMCRRGFIPYGPSRAGAESLSHIMAQDLAPFGIAVNILLPGGATETGMIPEEVANSLRAQLLSADIMAEPILFLCSDESQGIHDERIIAKDFARWKTERESRFAH